MGYKSQYSASARHGEETHSPEVASGWLHRTQPISHARTAQPGAFGGSAAQLMNLLGIRFIG